jgi:hypothetical protein
MGNMPTASTIGAVMTRQGATTGNETESEQGKNLTVHRIRLENHSLYAALRAITRMTYRPNNRQNREILPNRIISPQCSSPGFGMLSNSFVAEFSEFEAARFVVGVG